MIILLFVYGMLLIRVAGSDVWDPHYCNIDIEAPDTPLRRLCDTNCFEPKNLVKKINKCMDHMFRVCTKAADDIKELSEDKRTTLKDEQCGSVIYQFDKKQIALAYLMVMEKFDYKADYYEELSDFPRRYIRRFVKHFKVKEDHNKFMPEICPNYTMKACRSILIFCGYERYRKLAYCADPSFIPYKEYLQCYFTPSEAKGNCDMVCNKVVTKQLFGIEKTDDVYCKKRRERCLNIETAELIPECEGTFKEKCDVSNPNTYSQCEEAIKSMKMSPQLQASTLKNHTCNGPSARLICMQYLKLLGEEKMASQFVKTQCSKQLKPEICTVLQEYCGNSNLALPKDPPECEPQTAETKMAPHNQSYYIRTTDNSTSQNWKTQKLILCVLQIGLLLLI